MKNVNIESLKVKLRNQDYGTKIIYSYINYQEPDIIFQDEELKILLNFNSGKENVEYFVVKNVIKKGQLKKKLFFKNKNETILNKYYTGTYVFNLFKNYTFKPKPKSWHL